MRKLILFMLPLMFVPRESSVTALQVSGDARPVRYAVPPIDEAAKDPDFQKYRGGLLVALRARDVAAVSAAVESSQRDYFVFQFDPQRGQPNLFYWPILERLLQLGGGFTTRRGTVQGRREFCAPYVYSHYPARIPDDHVAELDPWVVTGERVPVFNTPSKSARVVTYLSHELVTVDGGESGGTPPQWYSVIVGNREGWVAADQIRNPEDYHACFARIDGKWLLTSFARGPVPPQ